MQREYHLPIVVKLRKQNGKIVQGCHVYIGRKMIESRSHWDLEASEWKNPFTVNKHGDRAIALYEEYIRNEIAKNPDKWNGYIYNIISQGKPLILGCWCKADNKGNYRPEIPCHGDVIVKLCAEYIAMLSKG